MAKMLWAVRIGNEDWREEIITTNEDEIDKAREWARGQGFGRFRVSEYTEGERPDFTKTINRDA